jgi:hypothetical protein
MVVVELVVVMLSIEEGCCGGGGDEPSKVDNRQKFGCRLELLRGITCAA